MNENYILLAGAGIVFALIAAFLKQHNKEYGIIVSLLGGLIILYFAIKNAQPVFNFIQDLTATAKLPNDAFIILLKVLGIAYITQLSCDVCRDSGETALASKLELLGKFTILIFSIPLFEKVLSLILKVLG